MAERPRFSGRKLPGIKQEVIGFKDAYSESQRVPPKPSGPTLVPIRMIGGPLDGGRFHLPEGMLRVRPGERDPEVPVEVPGYKGRVVLPTAMSRKRHAIYRLDRSSKLLRYVRTIVLPGE